MHACERMTRDTLVIARSAPRPPPPTCTASVHSGLGFSQSFSVKVDSDPEVRIGLWRLTPLSWRRGRFPWFAFLRFSSCRTLTRWSTFVVQVLQFSSADAEESAELHSCAVLHGHWRCTCPSLCNDRCRMVDDVAPFIDCFRRPCDHAET